nr:MAG: polyprotein [Hangzhou scatella stagnalis Solinvi-like virus 1]
MSDNIEQQTNQPHMASSAFPNEETENMKDILEIISTFVSEYISSGVVCKAVNITSPVLAIISNVYALFNMSHTIIKTSTVIATLGIHIVHLINMLLETFNIKASIKQITQYVHEIIIEQITPTMNNTISNLKNVKPNNYVEHVSTFMSWLKPVLATTMLAIGFIIPKFDINEWCKALNTRITAMDKVNGSISEISNKILEDLCGIDLYGSKAIIEQRKALSQEGVDLCAIPCHDYIRDLTKREQLFSYPKRALDILAHQAPSNKNDKTVKIIAQLNNTINSCIKEITNMQQLINETVQSSSRPPTIGVLLSGSRGVGKSRFAAYSMNQIADKLNLDKEIFSVNKNGDFFDPYKGNHFGIYDEFLYQRSSDNIIPTITKMLSGEYFNFEGAALGAKKQTCELKMVTFTTNMKDPSTALHKEVNQHAVEAIWDRIVRVNVYDQLNVSRHLEASDTYSHRKPDFSHLELEMTISTDSFPKNTEYMKVTAEEYIRYFTYRIAYNMEKYTDANGVKIYSNDSIRSILESEKQFFQDMTNRLISVLKNKDFIESMVFSNKTIKQNNLCRKFFVLRLEGHMSTGKTTSALQLSDQLTTIFNMEVIKQDRQFSKVSHKPCIYIVDDVLDSTNSSLYMQWINNTHVQSIIIICTNILIPTRRTWGFTKYYDLSNFCKSSGIARRLGLKGYYNHNGEYGHINDPYSIHVTFDNVMKYENCKIDKQTLYEMVYDKYIEYIKHSNTISVVNEIKYIDNPDIYIKVKSYKYLTDILKSPAQLLKGFTNPSNKFAITVKNTDIVKQLSRIRSPEQFSINITDDETFISSMKELIEKLLVYKHDATIKVEVSEQSMFLVYEHRILYIQNLNILKTCYTKQGDDILIPYDNTIKNIKLKDLAWHKVYNRKIGSIEELDYKTLLNIYTYVRSDFLLNNRMNILIVSYEMDKDIISRKAHIENKYSPIIKIISLTTGLIGLFTIGSNLYKLLKPREPTYKTTPNTTDDEDNAIMQKIQQKYVLAYNRGDDMMVVRRGLHEEYGDDFVRFDHWIRSNGTHTALTYIESADWKGLQKHWTMFPNDIPTISRNAITSEMITFQKSTEISTLADLLEKNMCILGNKTTGSKNFAIGINDVYLVSVAHSTRDCMNSNYIIYNGKQYDVTCIKIYRERDIAFFKLNNSYFKFRDIRRHFCDNDLLNKTKEGYYIRPIKGDRMIAACTITYTAKRTTPLDDNPWFKPDTGLYTVLFSTTRRPEYLKNGDCGFPLIAKTIEGLKIIGIHNAITETNIAFFASISNEDVYALEVKNNSIIYHGHLPGQQFYTHEWYNTILNSTWKTPKVKSDVVKVYGYIPESHLPSFPKDNHVQVLTNEIRESIKEKLPTLPSALKYIPKYMDDSKLVKDSKGIPHTLWTQAVKYGIKYPLYQQWDERVYKTTFDIIRQRIKRDYLEIDGVKLMSLAENISGDGTDNNKAWNMKTSAGPLLKKLFNIHTKEDIFINKAPIGSRPFYIFADTQPAKLVRQLYQDYCDSIDAGRPVSIWCRDNRKVELLPSDKVREGKVRLFNEIDLSVNMMLKRYFGNALTNIIKKHTYLPYKIGMDVYSEAHFYHQMMQRIDGDIISTDISGCDKSMPKEIIEEFCKAFLQGLPDSTIKAISDSLIYTIHIMDGIVYEVNGGNESGSYVTTMLNCFAMEVITIYPVIEKLMMKRIVPTLNIVEDALSAIYYGDDRSVKFSRELGISENDLVRCGEYFNFKVTPAKVQSQYISFCSREFIPNEYGIIFPKLKQTSILSCLFWVKKLQTEYIVANVMVALFEASLHDKPFYERVKKIVSVIMREYPEIKPYIQDYSYEWRREIFSRFIYGESNVPILLKTGETEESNINISEIHSVLEEHNIHPNNYTTIIDMDYVSYINHTAQVNNLKPVVTYSQKGPKESCEWECTLHIEDKKYSSTASTKKEAHQLAAKEYYTSKITMNATIQPIIPMQNYCDTIVNTRYFTEYSKYAEVYNINDNMLLVVLDSDLNKEMLAEKLQEYNLHIINEKLLSTYNNNKKINKLQVIIGKLHIKQNNDQPIEPATINQAASSIQKSNLPSMTNPQPTAINPAMTNNGEDVMGALGITEPETLNPIGAPDMLSIGAITFDIKELIYQQFIDCDQQLTISDDAVEGSIIAQIPYGLQSEYINKYITYYARAHERFTGSIQFRFTVIGNPLFSGAIGIAWYPRKIKKAIAPISELMKYSYQAEGVTMPWNKIHVLHDARKSDFYRLVEDEQSNYDARPHLIIFLMMSLQNPLREGIQTRIRIASKLANANEPNPFIFANPEITPENILTAPAVPGLTTNQGADAFSLFPHLLNQDCNIFTDGSVVAPQIFDFGTTNRSLVTSGPSMGAYYNRLINGKPIFDGPDYVYQFNEDKYRIRTNITDVGLPQLFITTNVPKDQYKIFQKILCTNLPSDSQRLKLTSQRDTATYTGNNPDVFTSVLNATIIGINQAYNTNKFGVTGWSYSRSDTPSEYRFGSFKIITTHGVIILSIVICQNNATDIENVYRKSSWTDLDYNGVDVLLQVPNSIAGFLPTRYVALRMTDQVASGMPQQTLATPTATDDPVISKYFKLLSNDIPVTQCYQFEIQDQVSFSTIAVVRYLQEYGMFVIKDGSEYALFPQTLSKTLISKPQLVNRTNNFPSTDTSQWLKRRSQTFRSDLAQDYEAKRIESTLEYYSTGDNKIKAIPNASMIAGGAMAGIGNAMQGKANRKHELKMQGNMFEHDLKYQKRDIVGKGLLSAQQFRQGKAINKMQNQHQMDMMDKHFNQQMVAAGRIAPVSGATTNTSQA